ncbi:putative transcription factor interactor and regulator CCHC(Zn) family [Helianthus annuus]|uniref:Transcription factor interactor and regulator CCHC(Zn) family n=1 Tax=Helianthus annuus TaxID=4232 RepID=A0A9K3P2T3_HELAN|nr:putative transcription factor interactor and regulator CCHC(Zn) family [Helianthus annuus]KAJ0622612.1 putative transcription factor interactor and regulator CCHC(Zn) family [Helianthus annuus]KAJ0626860.1 putative transcription factor interactor and regulator CCHC(Zn) family [Helianthus annuus]
MTIDSNNPQPSAAYDHVSQHSGIRATSGKRAEIKPSSTTMPCQHCVDENNEKDKRIPRVRLCYYCHQLGHHIYMCKAKENDKATQLIKQTINTGIRRQDDEVNCQNEMIVTGTEGGQWGDIWYVSPTFNHHFAGNLNVFKRIKHMIGVETKSGENNFLFIRGIGAVEMKSGNDMLRIQSVFYSPELDRNVLSLDQLTLQGFTVRKSGDTCKIFPMFSAPVSGLTKEDGLGLNEKQRMIELCSVNEDFKENYLNSYFETLHVSNDDENAWSLMIIRALEFHDFADCKSLLDMIDDRDFVFKYKHELEKKFEEMVAWFLNARLENSLVAIRLVWWGLATTRDYSGLLGTNRIGTLYVNFIIFINMYIYTHISISI